MKREQTLVTTALLTLLAGCAAPPARVGLPQPLSPRAERVETTAPAPDPDVAAAERRLRLTDTPRPPLSGRSSAGLGETADLPPLGETPLSINVEGVPAPVFINEVFGNLLALNFQIDPSVNGLQELVTLRTATPQSPTEVYRLARQVLAEYGIETTLEGNLVRLKLAADGSRAEPPLILSGRALPDVPISHRPVFHLVQIESARSGEVGNWLRTVFGNELKVDEDSGRNALLLSGRPALVRQALDAVQVFDRPYMRGRHSTRIEPAFMSAEELANRLNEVLLAEGYGASRSLGVAASVLVLPMPSVNALLVFSASRPLLEHAVEWARELDRPNPAAGARSLFYYQVKNTRATDIAGVLAGSGMSGHEGQATAPAGQQPGAQQPTVRQGAMQPGSLIVDEPRNALVFQGDPAEWERMLPLVKQMDKSPRQVMIEVTIAEVTLDDNEEFGVGWLAKAGFGRFNGNIQFGSLSGSNGSSGGNGNDGGGSSGLSYLLDVAGQNRAALRAFASDQRVSILSTPRLLVKSGQEASIDVGTEVPTITAQTTSNQQTGGNTNLLQSIQYRKTGIILNVKPTIYSDDRIDLDIRQEVSDAIPASDGAAIGSPSIFNRSVSTSLSLRDGGSIVLGGLMSTRQTGGDSGIPRLKDVPILGNLFKTRARSNSKTELVLMIVPYIIESDERAEDVTKSIGRQLELLELPRQDASTSAAE